MPEPTMRDLERLLLKLGKSVAEVKVDVAALAAEQSAVKLLVAGQEEQTAALDHLRDTVAAANQILTGVRSLSETSFDIATALSRRMKLLVQRLVEKGLIAVESLHDDAEEAANGEARDNLRSVEAPRD